MEKKSLSLILLSLLLLAGLARYVPIASAHNEPFPVGYDPTHVVFDSISEPETVDPAWCYDTASAGLIFNVYETVIFFDTVFTDFEWGPFEDGPYAAGKTDVFKPQLATDVSVQSGPDPYVKTFYFKIRGMGATHTFVATGVEGSVDLFKDGQIYVDRYFVRDPEYGVANKAMGPLRPAHKEPSVDGNVDRADVPANAYTGAPSYPLWHVVEDTTWIRQDGPGMTRGCVIRGVTDVNGNGILDAGDRFNVVRKCGNHPIGPWWNVREYLTVKSVDSTSPYTITAEEDPVYFHDDVSTLTAADVEYSWERWMVQDRFSGPTWMLYHPMLNTYAAVDPSTDPNFSEKIDSHIGSNATHAWMHLDTNFPETAFLQIMSQSWSSIVNKDWCVAKGDFDGNWAAGWETIYNTWHDPDVSFIEDDMMGTGPYMFDYWVHGTAWSVVKFDDYWDGWPAYNSPTGKDRFPSYVSRYTMNMMVSWTTRRARFLAGDADYTRVPRQYRDQALGQVVGGEPIRCYYPFQLLALDAFFFNFDINPSSPYLGPGFDPGAPRRILGDRIPTNLFSDINVRLGFAAAFNYAFFIASAYLGEGTQPSDPIIPGLSYDNSAQASQVFDLVKAAQYLKWAWVGHPDDNLGTPEGALWDNGMQFTVLYCGGNVARETATTMIVKTINSLNTEWEISEQAIRDNNNNAFYDGGDTVLIGSTPAIGTVLSFPDDFERYADLNPEWDVGESAIRDNNDNVVYDAGDVVLCGVTPAIGMVLRVPDDFERYAESVAVNDEWDEGEPAVRDNDDDGVFNSTLDTVLAGVVPPNGTFLKVPDDFERYADLINEWDINEPAIRDNNDDGYYNCDAVLAGVAPALGTVLGVSDDFERYADTNANDEWDEGEPAVRDNDDDGVFNSTLDTVLAGVAPPNGTVLGVPDDFERYADINANDEWDVGESAIRDNNDDGYYDCDTVLTGVAPALGTVLRVPDDFEKFADVNTSTSMFHLSTQAVAWGSTYLPQMVAGMLPLFFNGWTADYTDPDDFVHPFMHSQGIFPRIQRIPFVSALVDQLIEAGALTTDDTMPYNGEFAPEKHAENVAANGWFDSGEAVYRDVDGNGEVGADDVLVEGPAQADGTSLIWFNPIEKHAENVAANYHFDSGEAVYRDVDGNGVVSDGDVLVQGPAQLPGTPLKSFTVDPRDAFNNWPNIPPDTRWPRRSIYYELQAIYVEDAPGFCLYQATGRHWEQAWMRGWYHNPLCGNSLTSAVDSTPVLYVYHLWKAVTHFGDANNDGSVDLLDAATVSASWTKPKPQSPIGPKGYVRQADINGGTGATTGGSSGYVVGIPDGKVGVADAALVSAYWDNPQGPSHPP